MKKSIYFLATILAISFSSCSDSEDIVQDQSRSIAFANSAQNLVETATTISVVFSSPSLSSGTITLSLQENAAVFGTDYTTSPAVTDTKLVLPYLANASSVSFEVQKLVDAFEGQTKNIRFTITSATPATVAIAPAGNVLQLNFNQVAVQNNILTPAVGGPTVPKHVYVDLSSGQQTTISRDAWELAFYSGDAFSVSINGSLKMAVKKTQNFDITQAVTADNLVAVGEGGGSGIIAGNPDYVDYPTGNVTMTAIKNISAVDSENAVYLVNLGHKIATEVPNTGSINPYGELRGWKKIRILRAGNGYKLQYANIDSASFSEVVISKNSDFNYTFFSLLSNNVVAVEPQKANWDLTFTPFTNLINFGNGLVSYAYQDFVLTNSKTGTRVYQVLNSEGIAYSDFNLSNVLTSNLETENAKDQRIIGASWRNGGGPSSLPSARDDRFYILRDSAGNLYKLRLLTLTNTAGERGHSSFEYSLLQ